MTTANAAANRVADELYARLDPGGDLHAEIRAILTRAIREAVDSIAEPLDERERGEIAGDYADLVERRQSQMSPEIADLGYQIVLRCLQRREKGNDR